jgi:hypothetical protein
LARFYIGGIERTDGIMLKVSTVDEFIKQYPDASINEEHLTDIACPDCGSRTCFVINIVTQFEVFDSGVDEQVGDNEFNDDSPAMCKQCGACGLLCQFTFEGLDKALRSIYQSDMED